MLSRFVSSPKDSLPPCQTNYVKKGHSRHCHRVSHTAPPSQWQSTTHIAGTSIAVFLPHQVAAPQACSFLTATTTICTHIILHRMSAPRRSTSTCVRLRVLQTENFL
ncbi:hypothetical protein DQ04_06931050 [Trypanosoma grayi]|uniref:hypothetical protein n=1 Tax=Trypanosoma grayi TaxID=71804 RepID=UPI0004F44154|nr:hypothetical protein DQ04_06931050 [Trypanosoma grayi]KEG08553.1 hypothetical protein DQ04_06931050 [Trypanosoma grayi]